MPYLITSILVLFLAPAIYFLLQQRRHLLDALDGFVFIAVGGLVLLHLQPSFQSEHFFSVFAVTLFGFLGPNLFENLFHRAHATIHKTTLYLGVLGLILHALFDGTGLSAPESLHHHAESSFLPFAIIVHRIPVVLTLWWLARPRFSLVACWGLLLCMGVATTGGFFIGQDLNHLVSPLAVEYVQAFVAGMILHVVFFRFHFDPPQDQPPPLVQIGKKKCHTSPVFRSKFESVGNLVGIALLTALVFLESDSHSQAVAELAHHHSLHSAGRSFVDVFLGLAFQTAPALVIAYCVSIFVFGFLPQAQIAWLKRGTPLTQAFKGVATGLPLPICSCGVLPFYQTLVKRGAPPAAALAFLIATPELGIDALFISYPLLGADLTVIRLVAAAVLAFSVSLLLHKYIPALQAHEENEDGPSTVLARLKAGTKFSLVELVDSTAPWILFGLFLAALADPLLKVIPLSLPFNLEIILFGLVGVVVYVCASGATPIVAVLIASGVSPGAGLTFLLTGPATNISTFGILSELHGKRVAILFAVLTSSIAIAIGFLVNALVLYLTLKTGSELIAHESSTFGVVSFILICLLYLASLTRQGGRAFFSELAPGR
ncbi:MAG: permease [Bdellovibrionales bacterium]|nr:permease [Bdellovibrionales bacterium]